AALSRDARSRVFSYAGQASAKTFACDLQQLGGGMQVYLSAEHVDVTHIRRKPRQAGVQINAVAIPGGEAMDGEGVAKIIWPGTDSAHSLFEAEPTQEVADGTRCGFGCDAASVETDEQRRIRVSSSCPKYVGALTQVLYKLSSEILLERHVTASSLARVDMQKAPLLIEVQQPQPCGFPEA